MTRWLEASRGIPTPANKTDISDKTQPPILQPVQGGNRDPVLSVLSVLSERAVDVNTPTRPAIIRAMLAGCKTPGAIATSATLRATETCQELDRMAHAGLLSLHRNGALSLTTSAIWRAAHEN